MGYVLFLQPIVEVQVKFMLPESLHWSKVTTAPKNSNICLYCLIPTLRGICLFFQPTFYKNIKMFGLSVYRSFDFPPLTRSISSIFFCNLKPLTVFFFNTVGFIPAFIFISDLPMLMFSADPVPSQSMARSAVQFSSAKDCA